ncbi:MAG: hypothetical protein IJE45_01245 [Bacilli bacterium]|nr:hypothetical protein [Bacilli bacterium]
MINNIFGKNFPNNLRIARRKAFDDDALKNISLLIQKIEKVKNNQNKYLVKYLDQSKLIGKK